MYLEVDFLFLSEISPKINFSKISLNCAQKLLILMEFYVILSEINSTNSNHGFEHRNSSRTSEIFQTEIIGTAEN